jgi:hypothetical protein
MLWFNGVEAAVTINDAELPCYQVNRDYVHDTITCWIPSEAGKVRLENISQRPGNNNTFPHLGL